MKFTSEDLLKAMGLKNGDEVVCYNYSQNFEVLKVDNPNMVWLVGINDEICYSLSILLDNPYTIIQPKPTLTEEEDSKLKGLDKKWKWIVRDEKKNNLVLFADKPCRCTSHNKPGMWGLPMIMIEQYTEIRQYNHLFKFIKWEDEPYSIEELLKE